MLQSTYRFPARASAYLPSTVGVGAKYQPPIVRKGKTVPAWWYQNQISQLREVALKLFQGGTSERHQNFLQSVFFLSWDFTPRYSLKAVRDCLMNFSKRSLVPNKRTFCSKIGENKRKLRKCNPLVVSEMSLVFFCTGPNGCLVWVQRLKVEMVLLPLFIKKFIHLS